MAVRAKFRCYSITLNQSSRLKDGIDKYDHQRRKYVDKEGNPVEDQVNVNEPWAQPTVNLSAVSNGPGENQGFFTATPAATCSLTISNPHAAEFFELGGEYYVDFHRAGQDS